mmetsp:Transcript_23121/g.68715  ORF Transcript_23121/g.68715 Transcript_23121/m.68715 type:complete len:108 (+) Transcript_23121:1970-2293(+)
MPAPGAKSALSSSHEDNQYQVPRSSCGVDTEFAIPKFQCKQYACVIQECLQKYSFSQKMCTRELDDLVRCCRTLKKPDASLHCAGFMHQINETQDETGQEAQVEASQ